MEAKTNKTMGIKPEPAETKKSGASKVGKIIGIIFLCLVILSIIILIIGGDWYTLGFCAVVFICSIEIPIKDNRTEEEKKKQYEQDCKVGEWISLM